MRKGKVQLKRIEDKRSRQVTFSKRRSGLMKKAQELAVLCDADVALVVVSSRGRVYDFSSGDSLLNIFERYKIHVEKEASVCRRAMETKEGSQNTVPDIGQQQVIQRIEMEEIDKLNIVELTHLERQQDALMRQISFKKTQKAMEAFRALHYQITEEMWSVLRSGAPEQCCTCSSRRCFF